mmetsp:Transcript_10980/g.27744  ORF Transcript_10980/g.27744 Transcript_10980/m.27744 type:complete len:113 (-) Transcript_10980:356-694(-)
MESGADDAGPRGPTKVTVFVASRMADTLARSRQRRAIQLLEQKTMECELEIDERDICLDDAAKEELRQRTGGYAVPAVFINDRHIGGFDQLEALEENEELAALLHPFASGQA